MNKDYIPPLGTIPVDRLLQLLFSDKITLVIERGTFLNIHLNECLYTHPEYRKGNMTLAVNLSLSELQLLYSPIISPDEEVLSIESCNRHNLILDETVSVVFLSDTQCRDKRSSGRLYQSGNAYSSGGNGVGKTNSSGDSVSCCLRRQCSAERQFGSYGKNPG